MADANHRRHVGTPIVEGAGDGDGDGCRMCEFDPNALRCMTVSVLLRSVLFHRAYCLSLFLVDAQVRSGAREIRPACENESQFIFSASQLLVFTRLHLAPEIAGYLREGRAQCELAGFRVEIRPRHFEHGHHTKRAIGLGLPLQR